MFQVETGTCVCNSSLPYELENRTCIDCRLPKYWDKSVKECKDCPSQSYYDETTEKCENCKEGFVFDEEEHKCKCPQDKPHIDASGACVGCLSKEAWDE